MFDRSIRVSLGQMQILQASKIGLIAVKPRSEGYRSGDRITVEPYDFKAYASLGAPESFEVLSSLQIEKGERIVLCVQRVSK